MRELSKIANIKTEDYNYNSNNRIRVKDVQKLTSQNPALQDAATESPSVEQVTDAAFSATVQSEHVSTASTPPPVLNLPSTHEPI